MERPQRPTSRVERRSQSNPNVFADEYAVGSLNGERGQRRSQPPTTACPEPEASLRAEQHRRSRTLTSTNLSLAPRTSTSNKHGERSEPEASRRSSIAKDRRSSVDMLNEGPVAGSRTNSVYAESQAGIPLRNRPASSASSYYERSHSPFPSNSGPSHPYHMYPQAGMQRDSSIPAASSSSRLRQSIYTSQPAHPYGMYQQNALPTTDHDEEVSPIQQPAIQIGFPGRQQNYHRQVGPDGEEQYIMGPDGHTEELPPYSRYPEQGSEKAAMAASVTSIPTHPAPRQAGPESQEDLISPTPSSPPPQLRANPIVAERPPSETHTTQSSRSSVMTEKAWKEKTWKERRRTRVCGGRVPVWVLVLIASIVLFLIIVLGGVIGGLLTAERGDKEPPTVTVTSTQSMFDASLIPTPTGMPPIPSGQFYLNLGASQEQQQNCLTSADQLNAWSCNVPPPPLIVDVHQNSAGYTVMKMMGSPPPAYPDGSKPPFNFTYGAQPPRVQPMQRLYWVSDLEEPARGPALHFQTNYDKLVILDPTQFATGRKVRRSTSNVSPQEQFSPLAPYGQSTPAPPPPPPHGYRHRVDLLKKGDMPWFCYWNQTFVEGFVYMQQSSFRGSAAASGSSPPSATTSDTSPPSFMLSSPSPAAGSSTSTSSAQPTAFNTVKKDDDDKKQDDSPKVKRGNTSSAAAAATSLGSAPTAIPTGPLPPFPFVMKVEERRVPNSAAAVQPYCLKMIVPENGPPIPMTDDDGNPVRVNLMENDPSPSDFSTAFNPKKTGAASTSIAHPKRSAAAEEARNVRQFFRRNDPPKSCHCLWVSPLV